MDFLALRNFAHGCKQVYSADRWCLTGEAGVFADPFYSPGSDYISMSNTFIHDLILRDLRGEDIAERAAAYDRIYLNFFNVVLMLYEDLYPHFGNARLMMQKILWDSAIYLAVSCQLFFNRKFTDLDFLNRITPELGTANHLIFKVNNYFKASFKDDRPPLQRGFLDLTQQHCKGADLNQALSKKAPNDEALIAQLRDNLSFMEGLAQDILSGKDIRSRINLQSSGETV